MKTNKRETNLIIRVAGFVFIAAAFVFAGVKLLGPVKEEVIDLGTYKLEMVYKEKIGGTVYTCFKEKTTDTMYLATDDDIAVMYNPETGKPLTYKEYEKMAEQETIEENVNQ